MIRSPDVYPADAPIVLRLMVNGRRTLIDIVVGLFIGLLVECVLGGVVASSVIVLLATTTLVVG